MLLFKTEKPRITQLRVSGDQLSTRATPFCTPLITN